jgi:hypothetical protein
MSERLALAQSESNVRQAALGLTVRRAEITWPRREYGVVAEKAQ